MRQLVIDRLRRPEVHGLNGMMGWFIKSNHSADCIQIVDGPNRFYCAHKIYSEKKITFDIERERGIEGVNERFELASGYTEICVIIFCCLLILNLEENIENMQMAFFFCACVRVCRCVREWQCKVRFRCFSPASSSSLPSYSFYCSGFEIH